VQFNEDTQEIEKLHHFFSQKPEFPTTSKRFEELMIQKSLLTDENWYHQQSQQCNCNRWLTNAREYNLMFPALVPPHLSFLFSNSSQTDAAPQFLKNLLALPF